MIIPFILVTFKYQAENNEIQQMVHKYIWTPREEKKKFKQDGCNMDISNPSPLPPLSETTDFEPYMYVCTRSLTHNKLEPSMIIIYICLCSNYSTNLAPYYTVQSLG